MPSNEDFFEGATDMVVADNNELMEHARRAVELTLDLEALAATVDERKSELNKLLSRDIPTLMAEQGMTEFRHESGWKVKLERAVNGTLPRDEEKRTAILTKLEPLGVGEITNDIVEFRFVAGDNRPGQVMDWAKEHEIPCVRTRGVHAGRFAAWLKEKIEHGHGAEISEAGIWHGRHAKLGKPRGKKA